MNERLDKLERDMGEMKECICEMTAAVATLSKTFSQLSADVRSVMGASNEQPPTTEVSRQQITTMVSLPTFNGDDPIGWIAKAEQQFELHNTPPARKIGTAFVSMEGPALYWAIWIRSRKEGLQWADFAEYLVSRFDNRFEGNRFERLAGLKQTGSVDEYIFTFIQLASQVPGLTDEHYLGYFMAGLEGAIRGTLRLLGPPDLETDMEQARNVEDNLLWRKE